MTSDSSRTPSAQALSVGLQAHFSLAQLTDHLVDHDPLLLLSLAKLDPLPAFVCDYFQAIATENNRIEALMVTPHTTSALLHQLPMEPGVNPAIFNVVAHSKLPGISRFLTLPGVSCSALTQFVNTHTFEGRTFSQVAQHPNASAGLLSQLLQYNDSRVWMAVSQHAHADLATLARIDALPVEHIFNNVLPPASWASRQGYDDEVAHRDSRAPIRWLNLANNPNLDHCLGHDIFFRDLDGDCRVALARNPNLDPLRVLSWLQTPDLPHGSEVKAAQTMVRTLDALSDRFRDEPEKYSPLVQCRASIRTLHRYGYQLKQIAPLRKLKQAIRILIGSAHKEEVAFIQKGLIVSAALCLDALSALQGMHTRQQKLDRHGYLAQLASLNQQQVDGNALNVPSTSLTAAFTLLGESGVVALTQHQTHQQACDSLHALSNIVNNPKHDAPTQAKQGALIKRQIAKSLKDTCNIAQNDRHRFAYGIFFHDYLMNKERRSKRALKNEPVFYQARFRPLIDQFNAELQQHPTHKNLQVYLPENARDLRNIGQRQRHCIGGDFYAKNCLDGRDIVFATTQDTYLKRGHTFQFDSQTGELLQTEGFARVATPPEMIALALSWVKRLLAHSPAHYNT